MPAQTQQKAPTSAVTPPENATVAPQNLQPRGNAAANEQITAGSATGTDTDAASTESGEKQAADQGLANYESSLGSLLGKPLYDAVKDNVSWDKLGPSAKSAFDSAIQALVKQVGNIDNVTADPAALDQLALLLNDKLGPHADKLMDKYGAAMTGKLAKWSGAHPRTILMVALLAAAGAVAANVDIPTLKQKLKLGKAGTLDIEAKLGKIRDISLQSIKAQLALTAAPLTAAVEVNGTEKTGGASVTYGEDGKKLVLDGKFDENGMKVIGLGGELNLGEDKQIKGNVSKERDKKAVGTVELIRKDGKLTRTDDFTFDANSGVLSIGSSSLYEDGQFSLQQGTKFNSDGTGSAGMNLSAGQGDVSGNMGFSRDITKGAYGLEESDKLTMGLAFKRSDLVARLDASFSNAAKESSTLSGSVKKDFGNGYSAGGDFKARLDRPELLELGAFYGFKDPKEFKSFLLDYRYKSGTSENVFGLTVEREFADIKLRWKESVKWGGNEGTTLDTSVQGAKFFNKDTAILAGFEHSKNFSNGQSNFTPQVGVQYKGVPVVLGYDMEKKGVKIGISIPF